MKKNCFVRNDEKRGNERRRGRQVKREDVDPSADCLDDTNRAPQIFITILESVLDFSFLLSLYLKTRREKYEY